MQHIFPGGFKQLPKGAQKAGTFFVVGPKPVDGQPILFAEGYSTAASIAMAVDRPVVMCVDPGNMPAVAEVVHELFPTSPKLFLGDDDVDAKFNKGREKAEAAAKLVGGKAAFPRFASRAGEGTDFNDLHKAEGLNVVRQQVVSEGMPSAGKRSRA